MIDGLIIIVFTVAALGIWTTLCFAAVGYFSQRSQGRMVASILLTGAGLVLQFTSEGWALAFFITVFVAAMFQIAPADSATNPAAAETPPVVTANKHKSVKSVATPEKDQREKPIGGSRMVEAILFEGDPIRIKRARKIKKTFGHYPWYMGGDL